MQSSYRAHDLKRYSLELYDHDDPTRLIWKVDSDEPFTPMSRGDRMLPMDAPGVRTDDLFEIIEVEHLLWTSREKVRYVTRIYTRHVQPFR